MGLRPRERQRESRHAGAGTQVEKLVGGSADGIGERPAVVEVVNDGFGPEEAAPLRVLQDFDQERVL